jgi:hypothetical protein
MSSLSAKGVFNRAIFLIGWLLSPLTFWNDTFINIPLAYLCANLFARYIPCSFLCVVLVFYWISNGLGILIMAISGKRILEEQKGKVRSLIILFSTILIYSLILIVLGKVGLLRPL